MALEIDGTAIGPNERPYVIAEVGINARTDVELAERFIVTAAECGADAVKFQTHITDAEMVKSEMYSMGEGDVYDTIARAEWSLKEHRKLQTIAEDNGVTFLSTPFSTDAVDRLLKIDVPAFKIGSGELQNLEILDKICDTGKPLLVSTGMHTKEEVSNTVSFLSKYGNEFGLFYCVSEYPTEAANFDFGTIEQLRSLADVPVGFSDHSVGVEAAKAAIGYGADIVEKHFTLDRRLPGPDQDVSIEPGDLEELCDFAKLYHKTGTERTRVSENEREIRTWAEHSLVTASEISEGELFDRDNLTSKRPGTGISAGRYFDVIGARALNSLPSGTVITAEDVETLD